MSSSPRVIRRQPRGSINKRACENCRRLKIRCDGNAEQSTECSNCEAGTCVFDKSPRKNRQVEKLTNQVNNLETNLEKIKNDFQQQITELNHIISVLKQEKEIQGLLFRCQSFFNCQEDQVVFGQLSQIIEKSQCHSVLLPLIKELLTRLPQDAGETEAIINTLKGFAEGAVRSCQPDSSFNIMIIPPTEFDNMVRTNQHSENASSSEIISPTDMYNNNFQSPMSEGQEITPYFSNLDISDLFYNGNFL